MYNKDYYESGIENGISGYRNYRWIPELTIRMAHCLIQDLSISTSQSVLDYGCAKGYLVKALRLLDINAFGLDVSQYAISQADPEIREYVSQCSPILSLDELCKHCTTYDWFLAKDVFEHIHQDSLLSNLNLISRYARNIFFAVPLAYDNKYIIPAYEDDVTHVIRENKKWWCDFVTQAGWTITSCSLFQRGVTLKEIFLSLPPHCICHDIYWL